MSQMMMSLQHSYYIASIIKQYVALLHTKQLGGTHILCFKNYVVLLYINVDKSD